MCGRLCCEYHNGQLNGILVPEWRKCYDDQKLDDIIFQDLKGKMVWESLTTFAAIARRCLSRDPKDRPKMDEIVKELLVALEKQTVLKISKVNKRRFKTAMFAAEVAIIGFFLK
ncbi:hypothetical protein L2E82_51125 [Cichorium intybus]|nr:hypothetical protein L2E82_51125 [Cichorium intybus]